MQRRESALAVVDEEGCFVGLIPPERLLSVLLSEHDEDVERLSGLVRDNSMAQAASTEPVVRRFRHRVPWLLLGLAGSLLTAWVVGSFEEILRANVVLAFFIPGIVYMADAVGTQTEALVIRGLSVGIPIRQVAGREILTGLSVGAVLSLAFFPVAWFGWGDRRVALAAGLALASACAMATVIAMALPALLHRLGADPAYGSGPIATVLQDLLSLVVFFLIASAIGA